MTKDELKAMAVFSSIHHFAFIVHHLSYEESIASLADTHVRLWRSGP
jgi:hypothetical protein